MIDTGWPVANLKSFPSVIAAANEQDLQVKADSEGNFWFTLAVADYLRGKFKINSKVAAVFMEGVPYFETVVWTAEGQTEVAEVLIHAEAEGAELKRLQSQSLCLATLKLVQRLEKVSSIKQ